ncbi:MAG: undecaprenyldiphospho-muramoylpentapeptide beta-N-acetylglucosaminyltransferase [Bacteroidota bacterium]
MSQKKLHIIISGGGTGGHIFPAVSIARELRRRDPETEILFVGAEGGMEMDLVPKQGFEIKAVWISGIHRQITLKNIIRNLSFPVKLVVSQLQANRIRKEFQPEAVVGVGGYASGPMGRVASRAGVPLIICEQNAYPGLVNKWLAPKAEKVLLGNEAASRYFEKEKVVVTGNPIRKFELKDRTAAIEELGMDPAKPVILSLGGSLGALRLNNAWGNGWEELVENGIQLLWQSGKRYYQTLYKAFPGHTSVKLMAFIDDMATAYSAADLVVSRAGGSTISELIDLSKPSILVPSPNVSEDHQTKNARSLSDKGAALLLEDVVAEGRLAKEAISLLKNEGRLETMKNKIAGIEKHDAAKEIVDQIFDVLKQQ